MKIEFLTQDDPLYILPFFDEFFRSYAGEFQIARVSCCRSMGNRSRWRLLRELTSLYGVAGFMSLGARALTSRVLGITRKTLGAKRYYSFPQLCRAYGIPWRRIGNPNGADYVESVLERRPDVIVSVACPYILKQDVLRIPRLGCVNIHHAPLPRYKGMMPTFWQMYHGEKKVGVTIHYMAAKVDAGDALLQDEMPIMEHETLDHLIRRSKRHGAHCMARVLRELKSGVAKTAPLDHEGATYFTFPTVDQASAFRARGYRAI